MKVCPVLFSFTQIYNPDGDVRPCGWLKGEYMSIGKLSEKTLDEIWHGEKFRHVIERQAAGDFSVCDDRTCCYLAAGKNPPLIEIDDIPDHATQIALAYETKCNYNCTVCWEAHSSGIFNKSGAEMEQKIKKIEEHLALALPHAKFISAHGCGELFASPSILNQLANWKPLASKEECSVYLETNGSLFNEENWKKIENLGQYHVTVVITVMSFDEQTYQFCSGVKYPVSRIENNLRFIKSLREKGIINDFRITTVVQERNFRTLPEWFRRCDEEFGADVIRMRPFVPYEAADRDTEWVYDIRNKFHPYHSEYKKLILDNPLFKNSKLLDWGAFNPVERLSPFKKERNLRQQENKILKEIFSNSAVLDKLENELLDGKKEVIVNGAGALGLAVTKALKDRGNVQVKSIIDYMQKGDFLDIPIFNPKCDCEQKDLPIIFTWLQTKWHDYDYIRGLGYTGKFIKLEEIFDFDKLFKEDCECCK